MTKNQRKRPIEINEENLKKYFTDHNLPYSLKDMESMLNRFDKTCRPEKKEELYGLVRILDDLTEKVKQYLPPFQEAAEQFTCELEELTEKHKTLFRSRYNPVADHAEKVQESLKDASEKLKVLKEKVNELPEEVLRRYGTVGMILHDYYPNPSIKDQTKSWENGLSRKGGIITSLAYQVERLSENLKELNVEK